MATIYESDSTVNTNDFTTFTVQRRDGAALIFDGTLLANFTTAGDGFARWSELRIYRTEAGTYVTEQLGCSRIPGETTFRKVFSCEDQAAVVRSLRRNGKRGPYLTDLALDALEAADIDPHNLTD